MLINKNSASKVAFFLTVLTYGIRIFFLWSMFCPKLWLTPSNGRRISLMSSERNGLTGSEI